ncbi:MAG TPA: STAS/SEC14 domain-containing protein [Saprospiraceae bacterium]|nr:STAS/SEC14 domain-containing protein [Saprospiraceae bacterium]MCB9328215.1 STAS/SEC14 domain-containing protein [Lewinellaceae bacterium]HPK10883.1 STAS/SEC14 domain-containing protein [Saprospiraceae bacterium]HPQ21452.1 STAS/SEC14 domain-containing protein [Saprospiraceae bacterium]HRX28840.1 STAS/SEC14 domain-containing protein [Saprospiraceae bacterium]
MISQIKNDQENVLVFEATGKISKQDYTEVLEPAVKEVIDAHHTLNLVYIINTDIRNYSLGAMWEDGLMGLTNATKFHKVAVVTDKKWITESIEFFGKLIPGNFKGFPLNERDKAIDWAANDAE